MKKLLIAFILPLLFMGVGQADLPFQPKFSWTPPTEWTDNQPLDPAVDIQEYRLYCTGPTTIDSQSVTVTSAPYEWEAPAGMFSAGDYSCYMTTVSTAASLGNGTESAPSAEVLFSVSQANPSPIIIFTVQ